MRFDYSVAVGATPLHPGRASGGNQYSPRHKTQCKRNWRGSSPHLIANRGLPARKHKTLATKSHVPRARWEYGARGCRSEGVAPPARNPVHKNLAQNNAPKVRTSAILRFKHLTRRTMTSVGEYPALIGGRATTTGHGQSNNSRLSQTGQIWPRLAQCLAIPSGL